jgi:hypothetical protein
MNYNNNQPQTYRIVGIHVDGSRHIFGEGLDHDQASVLLTCLIDSWEFPTIVTEHEPEQQAATLPCQSRPSNPAAGARRGACCQRSRLLTLGTRWWQYFTGNRGLRA